jgi:anti-sigma regulatory factor (Ser/Thr protein kinase)
MVASISVPEHDGAGNEASSKNILPLLSEHYSHEQAQDIDVLQAYWEKSLNVALPDIAPDLLFAVLLCAREAVLNSLTHGCKPGEHAAFEIDLLPDARTLQVHISDPGPGHSFDSEEHHRHDASDIADRHRGLMLIHGFASGVEVRRNGAELLLKFTLN